MDRVIERLPNLVDRIQSFTTRARRSEIDGLYYEFVTREEVERRKAAGIVVQLIEFNGNYYGSDKPHIESVIKEKIGILAVVEHGIHTFSDAGYQVVVVKIEPKGYVERADRKVADEERAKFPIKIDKIIVNNFAEGGIEKATDELMSYVQSL